MQVEVHKGQTRLDDYSQSQDQRHLDVHNQVFYRVQLPEDC